MANVLVVDDQFDVVQGILSGIDWAECGIRQAFGAYSAYEARTVLEQEDIHILLCDIEMPGQSGLELFQWVRAKHSGVECIFLSSHAEFEYVQKAMQLGGFDYILQPARYGDIERAIVKAAQKLREKQQVEQAYQYANYWKENKETLLDNCLRAFLEQGAGVEETLEKLHSLGLNLSRGTPVWPVLVQVLEESGPWEGERQEKGRETLRKIFVSLLAPGTRELLFLQVGRTFYLVIPVLREGFQAQEEQMTAQLELALEACRKQAGAGTACYLAEKTVFEGLAEQYAPLEQMARGNVAGYSRVFLRGVQRETARPGYSFPEMRHWMQLLKNGEEGVREQMHHYLGRQKEESHIDVEFLARFHQEFVRLIWSVAHDLNMESHNIFDRYPFEDYMEAYHSLEKMHALIDYVADYFGTAAQEPGSIPPIERAVAYIHSNLEKNLGRTEIAEAAFLNPEYLSRLFKKEMGVSLNDYIIARKMELARSLLENTTIPVSLIASKAGYSNFSYFSKVFRGSTGMSPQEYRNRGKNRREEGNAPDPRQANG